MYLLKSFISLILIISLGLFQSCNFQEKVKSENVVQDFCSQIHRDTSSSLSAQLKIIEDSLLTKTGVYVLEEGDISMISRAWLTEYAEQTIDIQYFIFSSDNVGLIATDYLLRAADRGVKVRILIDDIMVNASAEELLTLSKHPNLSIKIYNPTANMGKNLTSKLLSVATDFFGFNQRMHNKTFIVDNKVVITGGRNIADEYFDYDHEYNFRDRDVMLLGEITPTVTSSFNQFWNNSLSFDINKLVDANEFNIDTTKMFSDLHQYACNPDNFWPQVREKIKTVPNAFKLIQASGNLHWINKVNFVSDNPGKNDGSKGLVGGGITTDTLIKLIEKAKYRILIQTPYLITTELSRDLFTKAVKRGVEIKILTNSLASTDNIEAFSGYQRDRNELLHTGVRVFEFKPDASVRKEVMTGALQEQIDYTPIFGLHAKSMVIDDNISVIGTFNLDPRSANLNTECLTIIYDTKVANNLIQSFEVDMEAQNAWETTFQSNPDSVAGSIKQLKAQSRRIVPKSIL